MVTKDNNLTTTSNLKPQTSPPLVVIVGETASGKSALAMEIARKYNGEIICADSRTVYLGMDIGTAKPSPADQRQIRHHLINVIRPDERFTVVDFKLKAQQAIDSIISRGKIPIMVGGSGLYVDSILYDYRFNPPDSERDEQNPRHAKKTSGADTTLRSNTLIIGLSIPREALEQRVANRVEQMVTAGFEQEVKQLIDEFGTHVVAMQAPGYKAFVAYKQGELNIDQAKQQFAKSDLQLAKRQRTWFKRNKSIQWVLNNEQAIVLVQNFLYKAASTV